MIKIHICEACGMKFESSANHVKLCPDCRYQRHKEIARQRYWDIKEGKITPKPRLPRKIPNKQPSYQPTICWGCANAVPDPLRGTGCSWSREFEPVEGWIAEKGTVTYDVRKCPEFRKG